MIDFKGVHYPKSVILHAVFFYVRYAVSYRDLEEILAERGVTVDHATLNRWVVKFAPQIAAQAQAKKTADGQFLANGRDLYQGEGSLDLPLPRRGPRRANA